MRGDAEASLALFDKIHHTEEGMDNTIAKNKKRKETLKPREPTLLQRLDAYDCGNPHHQYNLVQIPPGFDPTPCNPIFLDLASPEFPDLTHRCDEKRDGSSGQQGGWLSWLTG